MDLVPNDNGQAFGSQAKEEQQTEINKERSEVLKAIPFLQDIIDWFDRQADETDRASILDLESKVPVESQILGYKFVADLLKKKKGELQAFYDTYKPGKEQ